MSSFAPEFSRFWLPEAEEGEELRADDGAREDDRRQQRALEELFERVNAARSIY